VASVKRDGALWEMRFRQGKPTGPVRKVEAVRGTGAKVYFHPEIIRSPPEQVIEISTDDARGTPTRLS